MTCGKHNFKSYRQAAQVANRQNRDRPLKSRTLHRVTPYHCPMCGSFHLTGFNN